MPFRVTTWWAQLGIQFLATLGCHVNLEAVLEPGDYLQSSKSTQAEIESLSLNQLKLRKEGIASELQGLALFKMRSDVGTIGFRSLHHDIPDQLEWIQLDLKDEVSMEEIVLVPTIWQASQTGYKADGFPKRFKIIAGTKDDSEGTVIARFDESSAILPRIAPLGIPADGFRASWIRLEADLLSARQFDGKYILQLAEILIFSDRQNKALGCQVTTSSEWSLGRGSWGPQCLVDGFLPYLMDAAVGEQSVALASDTGIGETATISVDLGESYQLDQVNLHTVEQSDTVPQSYAGDFGFPGHVVIEGSNSEDFSDAFVLQVYEKKNIFGLGPIVMSPIEGSPCRFVRLTAHDLYQYEGVDETGTKITGTRFGLAELELLSGGVNVAKGKSVALSFDLSGDNRFAEALTDGRNLYGTILPIQEWMSQLSRRHELETEQPVVEAELRKRYEQQQANLNLLGWVLVCMIAAAVILFLINRGLAQRAIYKTRQRIAADLHDELGANLHAIALLSDLARSEKSSPEKVRSLIGRIRDLAAKSGNSVKYCTNILETRDLYADLPGAMKRNADRLAADLEHKFILEGEDDIQLIKPGKRIDLFLFHKECLINIIRHSGATRAETRFIAHGKKLLLSVTDNGRGFAKTTKNAVPNSLRRRAKLVGAQVSISNIAEGGASVTLTMGPKWRHA
ncbi:MAG: ATP-binding protein [Verrucomicrobiae bacterium]|nr:ATP-binding protein [Verrucomicrobiae bacterium]